MRIQWMDWSWWWWRCCCCCCGDPDRMRATELKWQLSDWRVRCVFANVQNWPECAFACFLCEYALAGSGDTKNQKTAERPGLNLSAMQLPEDCPVVDAEAGSNDHLMGQIRNAPGWFGGGRQEKDTLSSCMLVCQVCPTRHTGQIRSEKRCLR